MAAIADWLLCRSCHTTAADVHMLLNVLVLQLQTTVSDQGSHIKDLQEQLTARDEQVKATVLCLTKQAVLLVWELFSLACSRHNISSSAVDC
jgi:hypothetical protein